MNSNKIQFDEKNIKNIIDFLIFILFSIVVSILLVIVLNQDPSPNNTEASTVVSSNDSCYSLKFDDNGQAILCNTINNKSNCFLNGCTWGKDIDSNKDTCGCKIQSTSSSNTTEGAVCSSNCELFPISKDDFGNRSLAESYIPPNLVSTTTEKNIIDNSPNKKLTQETLDAYTQLYEAATKQGFFPNIMLTYIDHIQQYKLQNFWITLEMKWAKKLGYEFTPNDALFYVRNYLADSGYSEFQLGTTLAVKNINCNTFDRNKDTGEYETECNEDFYNFLIESADEYGFIISYPEISGDAYAIYDTTGYIAKPFQIRYIGKDVIDAYDYQYPESSQEFLLRVNESTKPNITVTVTEPPIVTTQEPTQEPTQQPTQQPIPENCMSDENVDCRQFYQTKQKACENHNCVWTGSGCGCRGEGTKPKPTTNPPTKSCIKGSIVQGPGGSFSHNYGNLGQQNAIDVILDPGTDITDSLKKWDSCNMGHDNGYGNYAILMYGSTKVIAGHLDPSSACKRIIIGQNQGNSTHPHIHLGVYLPLNQAHPCDYVISGCLGCP